MTPAARLEAARLVLSDWQGGAPAERALSAWARGARYAGSKDRRAVRDHVYDVLRQKAVCADLGGADTPRGLIIGLARLNGWDAALFSGGYGPSPLDGAEAALFDAPVDIRRTLDTPAWLRARLMQDRTDWPEIEAAMAHRAPLYLRVNLRRATRGEAQATLADEGIQTQEEACPTALEVTEGAPRVAQSAAYAAGLVEPQDLSVQLALAEISWPEGTILDYCAGGGGKALAMAAATGRGIDIHDAKPQRMADAAVRAARAGSTLTPVDRPKGPYALVLTDVPCSGSGTWRRDPEAKWRLDPARLADLCQLQSRILDEAAALSDRIVYMTCSLLRAENEDQLDAFLARHTGWKCNNIRYFTPLTASDGFFVAELLIGEF